MLCRVWSLPEEQPWLIYGFLRARVADELLKARVVPDRIPFPTIFQVVDRNTVVNAIHGARSLE